MSVQAIHHDTQQSLLSSNLFKPITLFIGETLTSWQTWRVRRNTEKAVAGLSPHLLRDIHSDSEPPLPQRVKDQSIIQIFPRT